MVRSLSLVLMLTFVSVNLFGQELFVYTEPASNMATKSIGLRANNLFMKSTGTNKVAYFLYPELMIAVSKKLMIHNEVFLGGDNLSFRGMSLYGKYRFYSEDGIHNHFRLAAFGKVAVNNTRFSANAIELSGTNSGYEAGIVATRLAKKFAFSATASAVHGWDNPARDKMERSVADRNAVNYSFSVGKLMLPKEYKNYNQTNVNFMLEFLGQTNLENKLTYFDIAPSIQFILLSQFRIDAGYRFPIVNDLVRMNDRGFLLRLEYNIFNAYK